MTHDLVERLRWWGAKRKPPRGMEDVPLACREAADRIETYMADADAHVSRLDLVRRQEDEIRDLKAENAALRAEMEELRNALKPFVQVYDAVNRRDGVKLISKKIDSLSPITVTVTKAQFLIASAIRNMGERA